MWLQYLSTFPRRKRGESFCLIKKRCLLKQIVQHDSKSLLQKRGVCAFFPGIFEADKKLQNLLLISEFLWPALLLPVAGDKFYGEEDTQKMPLELACALPIEREPVTDPEIRVQALEAIYLLILQYDLKERRMVLKYLQVTTFTNTYFSVKVISSVFKVEATSSLGEDPKSYSGPT